RWRLLRRIVHSEGVCREEVGASVSTGRLSRRTGGANAAGDVLSAQPLTPDPAKPACSRRASHPPAPQFPAGSTFPRHSISALKRRQPFARQGDAEKPCFQPPARRYVRQRDTVRGLEGSGPNSRAGWLPLTPKSLARRR